MRNSKNLDSGYVYFIRCGENGPIKIGYSKHKDAESRLTTAQVYNPYQLTLLCVIDGGRRKESELHKQFIDSNIIGEWFSPTNDLNKIINGAKYLGLTVNDFQRIGPAHQNHHFWKGESATDESKRNRVVRRFKINEGDKCQICHINDAIDRFHKDRNLDNMDPENILIVCRKCCMELDGRSESLKFMDHSFQIKPPQKCIICRKLAKPLRKGRCHSCNEYYRRHKEDRYV